MHLLEWTVFEWFKTPVLVRTRPQLCDHPDTSKEYHTLCHTLYHISGDTVHITGRPLQKTLTLLADLITR